jgi:steroid Delta-isomerase
MSATYARAFETLRADSLDDLGRLLAPDVRFVDPFNDITGRENVLRLFRQMLEDVSEPRFVVHHVVGDERATYLRWTFTFRRRPGAAVWTIEGVSEVTLDRDGLVASHVDHWDAASQLWERLPLLGGVPRLLRRRLALRP